MSRRQKLAPCPAGRRGLHPTRALWSSTPIAGNSLRRFVAVAHGRSWHLCDIARALIDVRFSNRPFRVKRFQTIHHYSVDVARGLVLLFGIGTRGPSIMGFEDEAEQSFGQPCRQTNGRSKRTCE